MRRGREPGTVIDLEEYRTELREVKRLLRSPPDARPDERFSAIFGVSAVRQAHRVARRATAGLRDGRVAVAVGQYLVWYYRGLPLPGFTDDPADAAPFYLAFDLHWSLLRRKLRLDARSAVDLIRIDRAGRGDTEPRHALVKLMEHNFGQTTPPGSLAAELRAWGDELAVERIGRFRKLTARVCRLAAGE